MPQKRSPATPTTPTPLSSGPKTLSTNSSVIDIAQHVWQQYAATTPQRTLLLDAFMAFLVLIGVIQFVYCVLAGNYVRRPLSTAIHPRWMNTCMQFPDINTNTQNKSHTLTYILNLTSPSTPS